MSPQDWGSWLPSALLLLWIPGSLSLSGPTTVEGTVGGSLTMQCRYEEEFTKNIKYWEKEKPFLLPNSVWTTKSESYDRVSIRDHPANLTFTMTLKNLTKDDEGTYVCGIYVPWALDPTSKCVVSVFPAAPSSTTSESPTSTTSAKTSTVTTETPTESTAWPVGDVTNRTNSQEDLQQKQRCRLYVLLSLTAFLLLLFGGTSLLTWKWTWTSGRPQGRASLQLGDIQQPESGSEVTENTEDTAPHQTPRPQEPENSVIRKK